MKIELINVSPAGTHAVLMTVENQVDVVTLLGISRILGDKCMTNVNADDEDRTIWLRFSLPFKEP